MCAQKRETKSKENASLHCMHETKSMAERRRIVRNNSRMHARARKQGEEEISPSHACMHECTRGSGWGSVNMIIKHENTLLLIQIKA